MYFSSGNISQFNIHLPPNTHTHTHMHILTYTHTRTYSHTHTHMHIYTHMHTYTHMLTHKPHTHTTHTHACTHHMDNTHVHKHTQTQTHTRTHTQFILLMSEAILAYSPWSSPIQTRSARVQWHWVLQACTVVATFTGLTIITTNKYLHGSPHYTSWHGMAGILMCGQVLIQVYNSIQVILATLMDSEQN